MAKVTGTYRYASGEAVQFVVKAENSYPDALDQAKATVIEALCEVTGMTRYRIETLTEEEDVD